MSLIIFILILGVLVLIHEFGHFIAAKKNGVRVEEFGFGFPPRLFGVKKGETLYSINLLPIGGFVKLYGEEYSEMKTSISSSLKKETFVYKKPYQKAVIIVAGVVMNLFLGIFLYYILLGANGFQSEPLFMLDAYHFRFGQQQQRIIVTSIVPNSPASHTQLEVGDEILQLTIGSRNNQSGWITIESSEELIRIVNGAVDKKVFIRLENIKNGVQKIVAVTPRYNSHLKRAVIGISLADSAILEYKTPTQKVFSGFFHAYNIAAYNIHVFSFLISSSAKEKSIKPVSETVSGPIGIYAAISDITKSSGKKLMANLLNIVALLSVSLGIINILPFPALDGGRLVFILYEGITRKRVNQQFEKYVNLAGIIILLTLAVLVSLNDISKFFFKP